MKKIVSLALLLSLISLCAFASDISMTATESAQGSISGNETAKELIVGGKHILLVNDGASEIFFRLNSTTAATNADFQLKLDEAVVLDAANGQEIYNVKYICNAGETTTVRYLAWE